MFLEISQNSQENTCTRVSFNKVTGQRPTTLLRKRLWNRCFPVNFATFLKTPFLQNTSGQLLLTQLLKMSGFYMSFIQKNKNNKKAEEYWLQISISLQLFHWLFFEDMGLHRTSNFNHFQIAADCFIVTCHYWQKLI